MSLNLDRRMNKKANPNIDCHNPFWRGRERRTTRASCSLLLDWHEMPNGAQELDSQQIESRTLGALLFDLQKTE